MAATGAGVAIVDDASGSWDVQLAGPSAAACVAVDPRNASAVWTGGVGAGLWQSSDGGRSWSDTELPERDVFSVAVGPADGAVYAGTEPSRLFVHRGGRWRELEALQRIPSKPTWSFPPRPWTSHVRWIAPSPHDEALLLVGIELGGLMRSTDGGESFSDHRPGAQRDVHCLAWHPSAPGRAYETGGGGAAWSEDGGASWHGADAGMDRHYCWALAPDPSDPERWFASASTGPFQAHGQGSAQARLYRMGAGVAWEPLRGGLPEILDSMPYALAFAGGRLFAGLRDGRLLSSTDRGDTWSEQTLEPPLPSIVALAACPS